MRCTMPSGTISAAEFQDIHAFPADQGRVQASYASSPLRAPRKLHSHLGNHSCILWSDACCATVPLPTWKSNQYCRCRALWLSAIPAAFVVAVSDGRKSRLKTTMITPCHVLPDLLGKEGGRGGDLSEGLKSLISPADSYLSGHSKTAYLTEKEDLT